MKRVALITLAIGLLLPFTGCKRDDNGISGRVTLTNRIYYEGEYYYALGLSFSEGGEVPTLPDRHRADITLEAGRVEGEGEETVVFLSANTNEPPYALVARYDTPAAVGEAFRALRRVEGTLSWSDIAVPLKENQLWVMHTYGNTYAKLRIIKVILDESQSPPYCECTLEWVWQPDGSDTFSR